MFALVFPFTLQRSIFCVWQSVYIHFWRAFPPFENWINGCAEEFKSSPNIKMEECSETGFKRPREMTLGQRRGRLFWVNQFYASSTNTNTSRLVKQMALKALNRTKAYSLAQHLEFNWRWIRIKQQWKKLSIAWGGGGVAHNFPLFRFYFLTTDISSGFRESHRITYRSIFVGRPLE